MSNDIKNVLDALARLDENGLHQEVDTIDSFLRKNANKTVHKCGLENKAVDAHRELLEGYQKAKESLKKEQKKILLSANEKDNSNHSVLRDTLRNISHARNAVFLHEMYFADVIDSKPSSLGQAASIKELYEGGTKNLEADIERAAELTRSGWVVLSFCTHSKNLDIEILDLHEIGGSLYRMPVAALDMWEHAYFIDFGTDKKAYVEWWLSRMDWRNVEKRIKNLNRIK